MNKNTFILLTSTVISFSNVFAGAHARKEIISRLCAAVAKNGTAVHTQHMQDSTKVYASAYPIAQKTKGVVPYVSLHGTFPMHAYSHGSRINIFRHKLPYVAVAKACFGQEDKYTKSDPLWHSTYCSTDNLELKMVPNSLVTLTAYIPHDADLDVHFDNCAVIYNHDAEMPAHVFTDSKELYNWLGNEKAIPNSHKQYAQGWKFRWGGEQAPDISLKTPQVIEIRKAGDPQFDDWF